MIRPPARCHTRQIDINVIISASRDGGDRSAGAESPADGGEVRSHVAPTAVASHAAAAAAAAKLHHRDGCEDHARPYNGKPSLPDGVCYV